MNIITISREFGSGGREVGKRLADALRYGYYDREICSSTDTLTIIRYFPNIRGLSSRMMAIPGQIFIVLSSRR